ncbi:hypothetical protein G7054_g14248 [Neopestalotiopsis clavispora]|nr:hypothetical protein G7054_g14248 [Neopestalotiopsis clavispora]
MTSNANGAALFLAEDGTSLEVLRNVVKHEPAEGELLIEVHYSGINPADLEHAKLGITNVVLGYDFMGKVVQAGPDSQYAVGDVVAGYTATGIGRPTKYGTHQPYLAAPEDTVFRVPENLPHAHAARRAVDQDPFATRDAVRLARQRHGRQTLRQTRGRNI